MTYKIISITPGPKMSINEKFYRDFGKYCEGTLLTTSRESEIRKVTRVANFDFKCTTYHFDHVLYSNVMFLLYCVRFALKQRLAGNKFDLVVSYDPIKTGMIGAVVAKILGSRFIPEVNGLYTSDAEYMDGAEKLSVKVKKVLIPAIMRWVLKRAHGIKLLFDRQIDPFAAQVQGKVIARFPNHVSTSRFSNLREDKEVLFVGFPFKRKGVDVLIEAFKKIADRHPDWKLKILGWFPDPAELNAAMGGHPQIYHHPPVYPPEMPGHLGSCGIFVLPSRSEAMGRTLVEAMACAKPRIGSNVDGIPTVIEDGVDGLLVPPEDPDALAAALDRLMSDADLRQRLGQAALKRSQTEFSEETYFLNTMRFYEKVLT